MPDAIPAPHASARAQPQIPTPPTGQHEPSADQCPLLSAAQALLPTLESGRALDAPTLRDAMTHAFGATDADGAWVWKDAYEAAEATLVLFLKRYGRLMRRDSAAGGPAAMLAMLEQLAALEPSHTRRSEQQIALQQFSTPLPLAYAALQAAAIRPGDTVLEPSAGTGMLAVMAECALGDRAAGALHLNELAPARAELLTALFPDAHITRRNAEAIADHLPHARPTVVLMNPPFSVSPGVSRIRHDADLRHLRAAFTLLPPGGRLTAITSANCIPGDTAWTHAFERLDARVVLSIIIDGRAYARRGTHFDTRLTVLDRTTKHRGITIDPQARVPDAASLLTTISTTVPPRLPVEIVPQPTADLFDNLLSPRPTPRKPATETPTKPKRPDTTESSWGSISALAYDVITANTDTQSSEPATADLGPYELWTPRTVRIENAEPHPTPLVQSAAMAAVSHPMPHYRPTLPERIITDNRLSDAQLESVILAGQAHAKRLDSLYRIDDDWETTERANTASDLDSPTLSAPVRFRRGWMLGDGTGCGKGRQVAAVILDNRLKGRPRALWLSQSDKLLEDTRRDWTALGGNEGDVISLGKFRQGAPIPKESGILFTTYATLRSPAREGRTSRLEQVVTWLAGGAGETERHAYQGVIVFDEAHAMANAAGGKGSRGQAAPSQQGRAGLRLQHALPDARILYVSATGATTVPGLAYAQRLGLWGAGQTPFEQRADFVTAMEAGGVAAMEVVARDLKSLGLYQARALSYDGVEVDILEHPLTPEQTRIYNAYADAFKIIHTHLHAALEATGIVEDGNTLDRNGKAAAMSAFEGAKQRFFGHLLTAMKCPTLIHTVQADLDAGHAPVIQLVSTNEALMERRLADIPPSEWDDLSIDLTPRELVLDYLSHAFPVQLREAFTDEDGNLMSRPVTGEDGNPVLCQEAVAARDALITRLAALPPVQAALDQLIHHFGHDAIAEVTGRSRRVLELSDGAATRLAVRARPASANLAETAAFMDGTKKILVFSMAGGTGRSYHADLGCANTARRVHYLLEPGWRADQAIQGLGRTHRTHQASAPMFRPLTTDVKGERRFIATIARRLDTLGAITRGQRDSQSAMGEGNAMFRPEDNLESVYAKAALRQLYTAIANGRVPGWPVDNFEEATGLKLTYEGTLKEQLPPMPTFLNRLLALPIHEQNALFGELEERLNALIADAIESGAYDHGVETVRADSLDLAAREPVFVHKETSAATELCEVKRRDKLIPLTADAALALSPPTAGQTPRLMTNDRSERAALVLPHASRTLDNGIVEQRVRLVRPAARETMAAAELDASNWHETGEPRWRSLWNAEIEALPAHTETRFWLVTGLLLPIWDRLPDKNMRVRRLTTDAGEPLLGRVLNATEQHAFRAAFGLDAGPSLTPDELYTEIMRQGTAFALANGWRLARRLIMNAHRIEIEGPADGDIDTLKRMGCTVEIISWRTRVFAPNASTLELIVGRWPLIT